MKNSAGKGSVVLFKVEYPQPGFWVEPGITLSGRGWAIADADIADISIYLGDAFLCYATHGIERQDIAQSFPGYSTADHSGFSFAAPVSRQALRAEGGDLTVRLRTVDDVEVLRIVPGARMQPDDANVIALHPQSDLWPIRLAVDEARVSAQGLLRLHGWVASLSPVTKVEVFLGEVCLNEPQRNISRPDIAAIHGVYPNAATSGFMLVQDVSVFQTSHPVVRVQATSVTGARRQVITPIQSLASAHQVVLAGDDVQMCCDEFSIQSDGNIAVSGWALAADGAATVHVSLDDMPLGLAETGLSRPDIGNRFPHAARAAWAGFRFTHRLNRAMGGRHHLSVAFRSGDRQEHRMELPVEVHDLSKSGQSVGDVLAAPVEFFKLEIDSPGLTGARASAPLRGMLTLSGWAVAQEGIDRVEVWIDEQDLGKAYLGMRREDVGAAFPELEGSLLSGFVMTVPHRAVGAGEHSVRVVACAKSGRSIERVFQLTSELAENSAVGLIRRSVPQAETDQRMAILAASGQPPAHVVLVCAPDITGMGADALHTTLDSLREQTYPHWQAIVWLAHDSINSTPALDEAGLDRRVRVHGASDVPPQAFTEAGSHTLLSAMVAGDRLSADALLEMAVESALGKGADFIYGDERRHDIATGSVQPWFKPDWSPELLLATNYIGRSWCATATLVRAARLTPADLAGDGNYDAVLRLTELAREIRHVPRVIYECPGRRPDASPDSDMQALRSAIKRRNLAADVRPGRVPGSWRVAHDVDERRLVSIIMPTCAAGGLVKKAISGLRERTDYPALEIICVDNIPADKPESKAWLQESADRVISLPEVFNWSRFNNLAATAANGEFLLFLNDDVEIADAGWLRAMLEHAQHPEVGAVGPQLLYPNGTVQHAGVFLSGSHGLHAFRFLPEEEPGPFGLALTSRNVTAVTGACLLTRRSVFDALGGFDEAHSIVNNDLDFCLRVIQAGLRVVYTPHASLIHHELASRARLPDTFDAERFDGAWRTRFLRGDPLFNPNLTPGSVEYLPEDELVEQLHAGHPLIAALQVSRILVVKLDHIGDFLTAMPALRRLKHHFPQAEITVLAAHASLQLAPMEPAIDHVIEFNLFHAKSSKGSLPVTDAEFDWLRATLTERRFDIAVDLRMQPDTRHILRLGGARLLAGYDFGGRFPWLDVAIEWEGDMRLLAKRAHVTDRLLLLADAIGNACLPDRAALPGRGPPSLDRLAALLRTAGADAAFPIRNLICVHPGAGNAMKQWPAESYAGLIDVLVEQHDVSVIIIGAEDDRDMVGEVLESVTHRTVVQSVVALVPLAGLAELLECCVLYVGNDSGPKHLAASLGIPTVGVHSGNIDAAEWGPLGPRAVAVRRRTVCSPCYISREADCHRALACLRGIRVQDVYQACRPLLEFRMTSTHRGSLPRG